MLVKQKENKMNKNKKMYKKLDKLFRGLVEVQENIQLCSSNTPDSVELPLGYKVNSNLNKQVIELRELRNVLKELSDSI